MKSLTMWMYRRLAYAFPHEFQMVYGADLLQLGEDAIEDIWREHGVLGLIRLLIDIAVRVLIEYLSEMRRDIPYALRTLAKSRGFAAVGIISLGLGMGVTAALTSQLLMILRDVPGAREPDRLAMVEGSSYPYFEHYRDQRSLFTGAAVFLYPTPFNVAFQGENANAGRVFGHVVSPEYLSVIGLRPVRGRVFDPSLDKPGSAPVVFISDRFWRQRMDSDPDAVGRTVHINGQVATIIGIGPKDFLGVVPILRAEIFVPTTSPVSMVPELAGDVMHKNDVKSFNVLLRLAPGVTFQAAEAGLDAITRRLDQETLDPARNAKERRIMLLPGGKIVPVPRGVLPVLLGFTLLLNGLIVAIACMNLANMQLARATARRREVSIRLAVGASRFRLIRQLLTESLMLALTGGVAAILLAYWAASALRKFNVAAAGMPINFDITPDWRVLAFTLALSLVAGIGFGLAPALAATKSDLASSLKEGAVAQMRGYRRFSMRNVLMVCQVAGSLTLLLVTGVLVIGFEKTNRVEIAFDSNSMYLLSLDPVRGGYSADRAESLFANLADRLKGVSGVRAVALAEVPPFGAQEGKFVLTAPAEPGVPDHVVSGVAKNIIGAGYFATLNVPMVQGREFDPRDQRLELGKSNALPVVLNQTAVRSFFGTRDPLGRRISDTSGSYEVVGVIKDLSAPQSESAGLAVNALPVIYMPLTRADFAHPPVGGMVVMVRTNSGMDAMTGVRRELAAIDPNLAIFNIRTLAQEVHQTAAWERMHAIIYGAIGVFGMVLAAIGLAGVTAYSVARRRREIGIRMALGARKGQVLRLVLREGGGLVATGTVLGFAGAFGISRLLSAASSLFGPEIAAGAHDPRLIFGAPLLLAGLAMLACYVPARKSTKIDPLVALRQE